MRVFISISVILILLSCKKTGANHVKGIISDESTGEPVNDAKVYLFEDDHKNEGHLVDSTITNSNGEYQINYLKNVGKTYYVSYKCKDYFPSPIWPYTKKIERGKNAVNFSMIPRSYVQFRFIKTSNSSNYLYGSMGQRFSEFMSPTPQNIPYPTRMFTAFDLSFSKPIEIRGNTQTTIRWEIIARDTTYVGPIGGSFETMPNSYSFYAAKGDTLNYTFTFN